MIKELNRVSLRSFSSWLDELGVTAVTGWRWRQRSWIKTIVIAGRLYISDEAIAEFQKRAQAGEFASLNRAPSQIGGNGAIK